jgi:wyosine [tRNA(Phe)-imidazoG37] synthetase (radical SAM superfamily)
MQEIDSSSGDGKSINPLGRGGALKHIFGPVPSRRLGRSLGIDVVPYKTCSFDCVYCECGATTARTCRREEFFPLEGLLGELEARLSEIPSKPDVITLSGAGEPTLYSRMGELIIEAKRMSGLEVAVITNSSLLAHSDVREELLAADTVLPSLDAADDETFQRINRPHPACRLDSIINGLERFLSRFEGTVLFEILLLDGMNTNNGSLERLAGALSGLRADRIQINTAVRPGTVQGIAPVAIHRLERLAARFGARAEVIAGASLESPDQQERSVEATIISLLKRRPCTLPDVSRSLGIPLTEAAVMVGGLLETGIIREEDHDGTPFYTSVDRA